MDRMDTKAKTKRKSDGQGTFQKKLVRPTAFDLAALDVLTDKLRLPEAGVWRLGLARLVEFENVRGQVEERERHYA